MQNEGEWALQYGKDRGVPQLADALLAKLKKDQGIEAKNENVPDHLRWFAGLPARARSSGRSGRYGHRRSSNWMGFLYMVNNLKANAVSVPIDEQGTDVVALEAKLKELKAQGIQPKLFYTIPNFQNPSGVSTTLERRQRIAELAQEYGIIVLEDDAYHDLRFKGEPIAPIYTLDQSGSVW